MSKVGTFLTAVAAADNALGRYAVLEKTVSIGSWEEDGKTFCPLHMCRKDMLEGKVKPIGWCRPQLQDFIRGNWPAALGPVPILEFQGGGVNIANWVLEKGMRGIEEEFSKLASYWRNNAYFAEQLAGWRNERFAIFADPKSSYFEMDDLWNTQLEGSRVGRNHAFNLERAAAAIFGIPVYGVHMTVYEGEGNHMKIWVPKRSSTKSTYPNKLDSSVAGGIPFHMTPFQCLLMESEEEASLPKALVTERAKSVGTTSYLQVKAGGWLQPEIDYVYDLQLPLGHQIPCQDEATGHHEIESFQLMPVSEVMRILKHDSPAFKPNCGLILVEFLARHGFLSAETEENYNEIIRRCHRNLGEHLPLAIRFQHNLL